MNDDGLVEQEGEGYFASVSDLMVGVLFVFLLMMTVLALNFRDDSQELVATRAQMEAAKAEAEKQELMVIGSDDEYDDDKFGDDDDRLSTTSSLERIEESERKRRISFCTNNVYIHQDGRVKVDRAPSYPGKGLTHCPSMTGEEEDEEEKDDDDDDDDDEDDDEDDDDDEGE